MSVGKSHESGQPAPVSPLVFHLSPSSGVSTFLQLVHQVEHALTLGALRQGDQLPRIKDVVETLAINPNTVQKAYRNLEQKGLVRGRPGQGTFVEVAPETLSLRQFTSLRSKLVRGWLREARAAGLDDEAITALFNSALREMAETRGEEEPHTSRKLRA